MSPEDFNHIAAGISAIFTSLALIVGGVWTYLRFIRTREAWPKIEFSVDVLFVNRQDGFWVVEAVALVENKGAVRHQITEFNFDLRYSLASDQVVEKTPFLAYIPHKACEGSWLPPDWDETFIEPGIRTRYTCLARIPEQASMVLIHGKFFYANGDWHTSDKLVATPKS